MENFKGPGNLLLLFQPKNITPPCPSWIRRLCYVLCHLTLGVLRDAQYRSWGASFRALGVLLLKVISCS